jgi:hypothetical protein
VVRHPRDHDSGGLWHDPTLTAQARRVNAQGAGRHRRGAGRTNRRLSSILIGRERPPD